MATAEGKVGAKMCDLCDENSPAIHCGLCESDICKQCEKVHSRNKYTKDHETIPITFEDNEKIEKQKLMCDKPLHLEATLGCRSCEVMLCEECMYTKDHDGHDVIYVTDDTEFLGKIHAKMNLEVWSKLNVLQGQCQIADVFQECAKYGIARAEKVKAEIQDKLDNCFEAIKNNLGRVAKQQTKLASNKDFGLQPLIRNTKNRVKVIEKATQLGNSEELTTAIAEFKSISQKLSITKDVLNISPDVPTVEMLLPNIDETSVAMTELAKVFQLDLNVIEKITSLGVPFDYAELGKLEEINIFGNLYSQDTVHISQCDDKYSKKNIAVLYRNSSNLTYLFDTKTGTLKTKYFTFEPSFIFGYPWRDAVFSARGGIFINVQNDKETPMDQFNALLTNLWQISAIANLDSHIVVCGNYTDGCVNFCCRYLQSAREYEYLYHFRVRLFWKTMPSVTTENVNKLEDDIDTGNIKAEENEQIIALQIRNKKATLASNTSVYQFDWPDNLNVIPSAPAISHIGVTPKIISGDISGAISALHVDTHGNVLLGDTGGNIHWYDTQWNHRVILSIQTPVHGIRPISGGRMIVTSNDSATIYG